MSSTSEYSDESDDSSSTMDSYSDIEGKDFFKYPSPLRLTKSVDISQKSSWSDSSNSDGILGCTKRHKKKRLPPIGIFWDIENCQVPRFKSASAIVQRIRTFFLQSYREAEFIVVCDVKKEHSQVIQELHDSQVNVIHVSSISKNAADEKLRQSLRRFAEVHRPPCAVVLISGDVNFAADLSDLRFRRKIRVILLHNANVADALILCANEHFLYYDLIEDLPRQKKEKVLPDEVAILEITNLPLNCNFGKIKARLKILTDNCGGRVEDIHPEGRATVRFSTLDFALRAQKRINGEDVYGSKIQASAPSIRNYSGRKTKNENMNYPSIPSFYAANPLDISHMITNTPWRANYPLPPPAFQPDPSQASANILWRQCERPLARDAGESNYFRPIQGAQSMLSNPEPSYDMRISDIRPSNSETVQNMNIPNRNQKVGIDSEVSDDSKTTNENCKLQNAVDKQPVDLVISNLDSSIGLSDLRRLLTNMLKEYAMICNLKISTQADGSTSANIRVSSQQEAQFAISQLHRQKLGQKRIVISYAQNNVSDPEHLKALIVNILQEAPEKCMALFKFMALLESRYHCTISVSEVNKLKDVCKITEEQGCRIISLTQEVKASPPPNLNKIILSYCTVHCPNGLQSGGWCEINTIQSPNVMISLKFFCNQLYTLLDIHMGSLPFLSFQACYEQTFRIPLPVDDTGVPLEHFVMCVPNISIKQVGPNKTIKIIKRENKKVVNDEETFLKGVPPSIAPNIYLLCREVVDLLRTMDKCQLPLAKFIPAYHHHFGRQCRVAHYGHTKLVDLFESMSHIVQIIGDGTRRLITLSHSAQMRRFTSDLLKVLKVQPCKQISVLEFPAAYEKVINKPFSPIDYGLCNFEDLLGELPENTIVLSKKDDKLTIAVPKREQSPKEIAKTKEFSVEVVELLRHSPYCTIIFHKFVPAYHHHFGYQCKVSDYGFTKLIELFEAIPDVVKIIELSDGERAVCLTLPKMLKVLGSQLLSLIKNSSLSSISLEDFPVLYLKEFGYPFKPEAYECETVEQVIMNLPEYVQLLQTSIGSYIIPVEQDPIQIFKVRAWSILLEPPYCKEYAFFKIEYHTKYNSHWTVENLNELKNVLSISYSNNKNYISLTRQYVLAAQLYQVLYNNGGQIVYNELERGLFACYGNEIKLEDYNIHSPNDLMKCFNFLIFLRGSGPNPLISFNKILADHQVPLPTPLQEVKPIRREEERSCKWLQIGHDAPHRKIAPPKPDTPPSPGTVLYWNSPNAYGGSKITCFQDFSIRMPLFQTPRLMEKDIKELISPAHQLYAGDNNPWSVRNNIFQTFTPPDATELPLPDKLISRGVISDDSNDSGVNTKLDISPSDLDNMGASLNHNMEEERNECQRNLPQENTESLVAKCSFMR
ncbi:meiosis regulator and mRNA stability factor 1 isoform X2 [Coccinella septempunctata]|uniref:meiosis regulator and mRNA stability factor 1 isoform X2 n=1 Tax=Coccinella septempunctata TaxID=41139 RepID=UPI001D06B9DB|nr:meiosis regulator and mRNA stability factor 1 isoform X2 [Coccinella septempunctata]